MKSIKAWLALIGFLKGALRAVNLAFSIVKDQIVVHPLIAAQTVVRIVISTSLAWQVASKFDGHATFYLLDSIVGSAISECGQLPGISDDWLCNLDLLLGERERDLHAWALLDLQQVGHFDNAILEIFASEDDRLSE